MSCITSGVAVQRLRQERKAIRRERPVGFFVRKRQASARESPRCDVLRTKLTDIGPPVTSHTRPLRSSGKAYAEGGWKQ